MDSEDIQPPYDIRVIGDIGTGEAGKIGKLHPDKCGIPNTGYAWGFYAGIKLENKLKRV
ncbi:hypothetical protein PHLCEN_2v4332 [Hermanssonia centrifuga]|uniref:Uncharacterized protein n=1 Tax=Hermanssonia centrifuga TaxID=98765 RepID=A0A2R6PVS6_9APHY|nr:hypothetical protein PHLCEN_2v4332 [Hermanssonia centrifuga]